MKVADDVELLRWMVGQLASTVEQATIRGESKAMFLFACDRGRSVEVSRKEDAWWIEFWECDSDADAPPLLDITVLTEKEALHRVQLWLHIPSTG